MAKAKLGSGQRFENLVTNIMDNRHYSRSRAEAISASIGRKKWGKERFQEMAAKGRARHAK